MRLLCLEKGPGFRGQAGRRAIGVQIRSDRGEHGSENTAASPCHSKGLSSQRNFSHRPYVRQHHAREDERRALLRGPHPGAPPGPGPRGSRHTSAPGQGPLAPAPRSPRLAPGPSGARPFRALSLKALRGEGRSDEPRQRCQRPPSQRKKNQQNRLSGSTKGQQHFPSS